MQGLQAGDPPHVGQYVLLGRLGAGGMGQVFLGRSPGGRLVAVKVIRAELAADPGFRVRFAREVAAARKVGGVFTAPVMDADPDAPLPWLVTSFVDGPSLAQAVAEHGALPVASVLALAAGLAEGLGAVHAAGMVHRDLKPSNVLLARDGPRVIDFGIAQAANATRMTGTGMVIGSPGFMSPEQAEGHPVGPASDVFSLGAVLVFAATGQGPFGDGTLAAQLYRVVHGMPRLDELPGPVRSLAERCLAKDPGQRPSAGQFLAELTAAHPEAANLTGWLPRSIFPEISPLPEALGHVAESAGASAIGPGTHTQDPASPPVPADSPGAASPDLSAPDAAWPSTVTAAARHHLHDSASLPERQAQEEHPATAVIAAGTRSAGRAVGVEVMNIELDVGVRALQGLLADALGTGDLVSFPALKQQASVPAWGHVDLERVEDAPVPGEFTPAPPTGLSKMFAKGRYEQAVAEGRARYEHAVDAHRAREEQRSIALARARAMWQVAAVLRQAEAKKQHAEIDAFEADYRRGALNAVTCYCRRVLEASKYPAGFPQQFKLAYVPQSRQVVVEYELPTMDVVPTARSYKYVKGLDTISGSARPTAQIKALYASAVAQVALRTVYELMSNDHGGHIDTVVFNGVVDTIDPGTGRRVRPCLVTLRTTRSVFLELDLARVEPLTCLKHLSAGVSKSPGELVPVRPVLEFSMVDPRIVAESDVLSGT